MTFNFYGEFGIELVLAIPYIKWRTDIGLPTTVNTCKDMAPWYYFMDVNEKFNNRTCNNQLGGFMDLPNPWLHHNAKPVMGKEYDELTTEEKAEANGVLDYKEWFPPNYRHHYNTTPISGVPSDPFIVVLNRIIVEPNRGPTAFLNFDCLDTIFKILSSKYNIIYHRPTSKGYVGDEANETSLEIQKNGVSDFELAINYNCQLFENIVAQNNLSYNECQLRTFSKASGFISIVGGVGIIASYFQVPNVMYGTMGSELRPGYFDGECYYKRLSGAEIHPILDPWKNVLQYDHDYEPLFSKIEEIWIK